MIEISNKFSAGGGVEALRRFRGIKQRIHEVVRDRSFLSGCDQGHIQAIDRQRQALGIMTDRPHAVLLSHRAECVGLKGSPVFNESEQDRATLLVTHRCAGNPFRIVIGRADQILARVIPLRAGCLQQRFHGFDFRVPVIAGFAGRLCRSLAQRHGLSHEPRLGVGKLVFLTPVLGLCGQLAIQFEDQGRMPCVQKFVAEILVTGDTIIRPLVGAGQRPHSELRKRFLRVIRAGVRQEPGFRRAMAIGAGDALVAAVGLGGCCKRGRVHLPHGRVTSRAAC